MSKYYNLDTIYEYFGKDLKIIQEILDTFEEETTRGIHEIESFLEKEEFESIAKTAHRIKASLRYIGADELFELVSSIESLSGNKGNKAKISAHLKQLKKVYKKLQKTLCESKVV